MEIYALLRTERELKKNEANFQSYYMAESASGQDEAGPVFLLVNRAGGMKRVLCSYWSIERATSYWSIERAR